MALELGPGQGFLFAAIVIGVGVLLAGYFGIPLGLLGQILTVAAVVLVVAWVLKLFGIL